MGSWLRLCLALALLGAPACDRAVEPYSDDPVEAPDLSKIFPPGAERAPQDAPMGGAQEAAGPARGAPPPAGRGAAPPGAGAPEVGGGDPTIAGTLTIAPGLEGRVAPGAVVFVIARMGEAGPPVAVKRVEQPTFPLAFEIGPDDRMLQGMPFTGPFRLSARIDSDGNATTRTPGDLQGTYPDPVPPGTRGVQLRVDHPL